MTDFIEPKGKNLKPFKLKKHEKVKAAVDSPEAEINDDKDRLHEEPKGLEVDNRVEGNDGSCSGTLKSDNEELDNSLEDEDYYLLEDIFNVGVKRRKYNRLKRSRKDESDVEDEEREDMTMNLLSKEDEDSEPLEWKKRTKVKAIDNSSEDGENDSNGPYEKLKDIENPMEQGDDKDSDALNSDDEWDDRLDDEDYNLLEENLGIKFERRKFKRLKVNQDEESEGEEKQDAEQIKEHIAVNLLSKDDEDSEPFEWKKPKKVKALDDSSEEEENGKNRVCVKNEDSDTSDDKDLSDRLDDEDYDLLEENLGIKVDRWNFKRLKRVQDEDEDDTKGEDENHDEQERAHIDSSNIKAPLIWIR